MNRQRRSPKTRPWRAGWCASAALVLALLALAPAPGRAADYPWLSRSLFWQPYAYDSDTISLYHLDEKSTKRVTLDVDEGAADNGLLDAEPRKTAPDGAERQTANANPVGGAAKLRGDCEPVKGGRFGGALRFKGASGMLVCGDVGRVNSRTLEFWLRVDALPARPATLAWFIGNSREARKFGKIGPVALRLLPDGAVQVTWGERLLPKIDAVQAGRWVHLALSWSVDWPYASEVILHVNGHQRMRLPIKGGVGLECLLGGFLLGNDPTGGSGFKGLVDEVRFSRSVRQFYACDLDWPDRKWARERDATPLAQPFVRDAADLLFHVRFNGDLTPDRCAPDTRFKNVTFTREEAALNPAKVRAVYPEGVEGEGLMQGQGTIVPLYESGDNVLTRRGTVAFWMRPVDWDNYTRDNRFDKIQPASVPLFMVIGEYPKGAYQRIFHRAGPLFMFVCRQNMDEGVDNPVDVHPGRWYHIACTWDGAPPGARAVPMTWYLNGRPRDPDGAWSVEMDLRTPDDPYPYEKLNTDWWFDAKPEAIAFNNGRYPRANTPHTILDDFRIYRRPLAPAEIANLAAQTDPRARLTPLPAADMLVHASGWRGEVGVRLVPLVKDYARVTSAIVAVTKQGGTRPVGSATLQLDAQKQGAVTVKTPRLDFATYRIDATMHDAAGKAMGSVADTFTRVQPPWWHSRAGLSDKPMPGWTPVETAGDTVRVWGRAIRFAPSGLPAKVVSAGDDVLAAPVSVTCSNAGKPIPLSAPGAPGLTATSQARADVRGKLDAADFTLDTRAYVEFDGMMWFDMTLAPKPGRAPTLDSLVVRIPYTAASAAMIHWWSGTHNMRDPHNIGIGTLPPEQGVLLRSNDTERIHVWKDQRGSFMPYVMLTGMTRGMAWFGESDRGWTQSMTTPAVSVVRAGDTVAIVLHVISSKTTLDGPRTFSFGLHPIPVKPLDPDWRSRPDSISNCFPDTFSGNNLKGRKGPTCFSIYPQDDWDAVRRRIDGEGRTKGAAGLKGLYTSFMRNFREMHGRDPLPIEEVVPGLYLDLQHIGPFPDWMSEWADTWRHGNGDYPREFIDFASWAWEQWIVKTDKFVRGVYMDDCWGYAHHLWPGPAAYTLPDGHVQPGFQFRAYRQRLKRMRQISYDCGVAPHITAHTTHTYLIPYHTFFDLILDGEDFYASPPSQRDFIDSWPLDRMRFMHAGKWGLITIWLSWHGNSLRADKWPAWTFRHERAYTASLALHDIAWHFDPAVVREFGLRARGTVFIPYWDDGGLASPQEGLKISAWRRPGRCLVLLVNVSQKRLEASVRLSPKAMGFGDVALDQVAIYHRDPSLLTYFEEDVTTAKTPDLPAVGPDVKGDDLLGEERELATIKDRKKALTPEQRRAQDPDGKFGWKGGVLACPVRRHDYRLFEFRPK